MDATDFFCDGQGTCAADWAANLVHHLHEHGTISADELRELRGQAEALTAQADVAATLPRDPTLPTIVREQAAMNVLADALAVAPAVAIDIETTSLDHRDGEIVGVGFATAGGTYYVPVGHRSPETDQLWPNQLDVRELAEAVRLSTLPLIAHNAKFEFKWLRWHTGLTPQFLSDTMLAARLLRSDQPADLKRLAERELDAPDWGLPADELTNIQHLSVDQAGRYCAKDCYYTLQLFERQQQCPD